MSTFRIIALRVLEGCPKHLCKALEPNTTYFLYEGYKYVERTGFVRRENDQMPALRLYDVIGGEGNIVKVEVAAIVGRNGEGKSSLIEMMMRVLNNFAYKNGFRNNQETLCYVNSLKAVLYYEVEDEIYCIKCEDQEVKWLDCHGELELNNENKKKLFYSLVINYALYAYNSNLYKHESAGGSWLDGLFHKNDSYQTPLVLNPMRTNGNIDINNELNLSRQRLMSIYTYAENEGSRLISKDVEAYGFCFKVDENVKLQKTTLDDYFERVENDVCKFEELDDDNRDDGAREMLCNFNEFWTSFSVLLEKNPTIVDWLKNRRHRNEKSDLNRYLENIAKIDRTDDQWQFDLTADVGLFLPEGEIGWMNYAQLYRLALVFALWDILVKKDDVPIRGDIEDYLSNPDNAISKAALYIPYKILEIITTYPPYSKAHYLYDPSFEMMKDRWPSMSVEKSLKMDVDDILATDDYTTLKLHQTINYLRDRNGDFYGAEECQPTTEGYHKFVPFDRLKREIWHEDQPLLEMMKRLPPPIFVGDIMLRDNRQNTYSLSTISSGMMQRLNSAGALVYHLRNLDYRLEQSERFEYDYVSVVFEEVELYFHPEYQRTLIDFLLIQIEQAGLRHIKGIQLIYVTHSPFILSDISTKNVLYLSKEKKKKPDKETFAANIYDLLDDHFFLDETIGDVALGRIREFVNIYHRKKRTRKKAFMSRKNEFKELIELVADGYMKSDLKQMYYEMLSEYGEGMELNDLDDEILKAEDYVARLKALRVGE